MKRLLSLLLLSTCAFAQEKPKAGTVYQSVKVDLNGDGKPEKIGLVAYGHGDIGFFGRLKVWDSSGKLLWQAPAVKSPEEAFAFGQWEFGSSTIQWVGPKELLSAGPQSDLRPTTFKRFRWTGSAYQPLPNQYLLEDSKDSFRWTKPFVWDGVKPLTWVVEISQTLEGNVCAYKTGGITQSGSVQLQPTPDGMTITSWIQKMGSDN